MGNSSTTYIANQLNPTTENLDWRTYPHYEDTTWLRLSTSAEVPLPPPFELAKRLYRAQHAYIGTIFSFLSEKAFYQRLERVYARNPDPTDRDECLIYCQILLVFAFGQMYTINQWIGDEGPPGFKCFKHALTFLPNMFADGSILFVEVLSYVAYFMQSINRRDSAYVLILYLNTFMKVILLSKSINIDKKGSSIFLYFLYNLKLVFRRADFWIS